MTDKAIIPFQLWICTSGQGMFYMHTRSALFSPDISYQYVCLLWRHQCSSYSINGNALSLGSKGNNVTMRKKAGP